MIHPTRAHQIIHRAHVVELHNFFLIPIVSLPGGLRGGTDFLNKGAPKGTIFTPSIGNEVRANYSNVRIGTVAWYWELPA